jgi:hypothetical protein
MQTTTERIERLTHIVYELVDVLDAESVAPTLEIRTEVDQQARLADVKLKLVELLYELTGFVSIEH